MPWLIIRVCTLKIYIYICCILYIWENIISSSGFTLTKKKSCIKFTWKLNSVNFNSWVLGFNISISESKQDESKQAKQTCLYTPNVQLCVHVQISSHLLPPKLQQMLITSYKLHHTSLPLNQNRCTIRSANTPSSSPLN